MTNVTDAGMIAQEYARDGFVVFRDVIDDEFLKAVSGHVSWLQEQHPDLRPEQLGHRLIQDDPFWIRLVSDSRLLDIAEVFIGPNIALFASHYICKPPYSGERVLWLQDGAYWPLEPMEVVTLWLAVDPSTPANGCMRVIPGSHRGRLYDLRRNNETRNVLGSESVIGVDETLAVDLVLSSGDVEVHHPNLLHASGHNTSSMRRCGLTIRYTPTSTKIMSEEQPFPSAFLLRGDPGVNVYRLCPSFEPRRHYSGT